MSALPQILSRNGPLPARHPADGERIEPGQIYIAPPDHHLVVKRGHLSLARGPKENSAPPAVDPMFRTAARAYGPGVIGVVLTGTLDDGTAGLMLVKRLGGTAVVQEPTEALYAGMPGSAARNVDVDHVLPLAGIPSCLVRLARQPVDAFAAFNPGEDTPDTPDIAEKIPMTTQPSEEPGSVPSGFGCPECGGALWEKDADGFRRYRCRVGHGYTGEGLMVEQAEKLEQALWTALRGGGSPTAGAFSAIRRRAGHQPHQCRADLAEGEYIVRAPGFHRSVRHPARRARPPSPRGRTPSRCSGPRMMRVRTRVPS
ncbi:MAG: chemotaxis protein CheB [Gemmatimonadetes bacterium]|nr:chemotaxis protein CheB [Gemmatimonadota bacterium]